MIIREGKCPGCGETIRLEEEMKNTADDAIGAPSIITFDVRVGHPAHKTVECELWLAAIKEELAEVLRERLANIQTHMRNMLEWGKSDEFKRA